VAASTRSAVAAGITPKMSAVMLIILSSVAAALAIFLVMVITAYLLNL
jgi:hypothetical protein